MKKCAQLITHFILTTTLLLVRTAFALSVPVTEYELANGLRVVVIEDHRAPVVLHAVVYDVGGADEVTGKTGLAHFFEHLMFKGTAKYPLGEFDALLDENGVERNAFTSLDNTIYYERTSPALLELMMDLEADRMLNLMLTPAVFEGERKVVQQERRERTDSDPYGAVMEKMNMALYKVHPYGRPIVGLAEDVAKLTLDDAIAFYHAHYMPSKAFVVVVGDVVPSEIKTLAEKYYGPLKNPASVQITDRPAEPMRTSAARLELEDARISEPLMVRIYQMGSNANTTPREAAAYEVLAHILGATWQSRLIKKLVTDEAVASGASASYGGSLDDYGQFQITAAPRSGVDVLAVEQKVDMVLQEISDRGVSEEELRNTQNAIESTNIYQRDNPVGLGLAVATALAAGKKSNYLDVIDSEIMKLTSQDIQNAAKTALNKNASVTLILRPKS